MRGKKIVVLTVVIGLLFAGIAFAGGQQEGNGTEQIRVGATMQWLNDTYIRLVTNSMKDQAEKLGVELTILDGEGKAEKQVAQVENLIAQQYDVIIMNPMSLDGCAPAVDAAVEAGVPIFTLVSVVKNQDKCVTYVGSDAPESGKIQGKMIADDTGGEGDAALIMGPIGHDAQIGRKKGLLEAFEGNDLEVVIEQTANWQRDQSLSLMENWLQSGKEFDVVAAQNDNMAMGALKALENAGLAEGIRVYGIDATIDALNAIKDGRLDGTVFQDAEGQGRKAIEVAVQIANGESVDDQIFIPYLPVDDSNVEEYLSKKQ
ncbi:MAG: substrate-binding domain-containing protein [Spirochaetales bacterium]|nr:substrate-binding domain-containing protein [Spirochaetales bacterium]MCF7939609.1 substrate-binding domain-containing protein [Spirochaetales bacterium]